MEMRTAEDIYRDYEREVLALWPELEAWWERLAGTVVNGLPRDDRWPAGPFSHPRFIAVFRRYFLEILRRNERIEAMEDQDDREEDEEELWGRDAPTDRNGPETIRPQSLLIEELAARRGELAGRIEFFLFMPIGSDD